MGLRDLFGYKAKPTLTWAIQEKDMAAFRRLLAQGFRDDPRLDNGAFVLGEALREAVLYGNREAVELLLTAGADPNACGMYGMTPLMYAAVHGRQDLAAVLAARGARADVRDTQGETLLMKAANYGAPEIVRLALAQGAAVNEATTAGWTALHYAAGRGHGEIVDLLLARGAAAGAVTTDGRKAAQLAEQNYRESRNYYSEHRDIIDKLERRWQPLLQKLTLSMEKAHDRPGADHGL